MTEHSFTVLPEEAGQRIDKLLSARLSDHTRSFLQKVIETGGVTIDGKTAKAGSKAAAGASVLVRIDEPEPLDAQPEDIPIDIVYEDEDIAVINKAQGMVVHPAAGNYTGTLVNALMYHVKDLSGIGGVIRPGIVHRIDKDTSGLLVIAKNDAAHLSLAEQIREKTAHREYIALVSGNIREDEGRIDLPIARHRTDRKRMAVVSGGKDAATDYFVLRRYGRYTLVRAVLETGRTHQIRVHFSHMGHPVVGDKVYGPEKCEFKLDGQLLHAFRLTLTHPRTGQTMELYAPLPDYFKDVLKKLDNKNGFEEIALI